MNLNKTIQYIIRVRPPIDILQKLPRKFVEKMSEKGHLQLKEFTIRTELLSYSDHRILSGVRHNKETIVKLFNENLFPEGVTVKYILKWPLLVKDIVDVFFKLSSSKTDLINNSIQSLFYTLSEYRKIQLSNEGLLDRFVMLNMGPEVYFKYYRSLKTLEERLEFVSMVETNLNFTIEERYTDFIEGRSPSFKLVADKEYNKHVPRSGQGGTEATLSEAQQQLENAMREEKRLAKLGFKKRINTAEENRKYRDIDG